MNINDKIIQALALFKDATFIEVTPIAYKKIRQDTLKQLEAAEIEVIIKTGVKDFCIYTYKKDCFAYRDKVCDALNEINCVGCKFYKNKKLFS